MTPADTSSGYVRHDRGVFVNLLALYMLILYPILRANRYYDDDLKRALIGHTGWDSTGRPLTDLLMRLMQFYDHAFVDVSPLTQIGAVAILAWLGVLVARRYAIRSPWMAALLALPLGGQPFFLDNLSYKFDALSMSLALLLALLPLLALRDDRRGWWWGVLALFASLNLYQPAINACLVFILLDVVLAQLQEQPLRQWLRQFLARVLQVGAAMLIYQFTVGIHINGWVKQESRKIHSLHELPQIGTNFVDFCHFIGNSFNAQWWRFLAPVLLVLALFPVVIGVRYALRLRRDQPPWVCALLVAAGVCLPLAMLVCVFGPMLVLLDPPVAPRVLLGIGALLAGLLIVMHAALQRWRRSAKWTLAVACVLALGMGTIASAYGNALGEQKHYEDRIATRLADDLAEFSASHAIHAFLLDGSAGYAPVVAHVVDQFPLMQWMVPPYLDGDDLFYSHTFLEYYITGIQDLRYRPDAATAQAIPRILAQACVVPPTRDRSAYSLRLVDQVAVVTFRTPQSPRCQGRIR
jgi:hypothetical protein